MDIIGKVFAFVFGTLTIAYIIMLGPAQKMDQNAQMVVNDAIEDFVDTSCASGYISPENYTRMMKRITATKNVYNVEVTHQSKVVQPYVNPDGTTKTGAYVDSYNVYRDDEIIDILFPDSTTTYNNYPMKSGDYLKVTLTLAKPTMAARIKAMITKNAYNTISYSYGSYVGSSEENGMLLGP